MNTLTVIGHLTADPKVRTTADGVTVAHFSLAASERRYDRDTDRWVDGDTVLLRCNVWGDPGKHAATALAKGDRVLALGRLIQRHVVAIDLTTHTVLELDVEEIGPSLRYLPNGHANQAPTSTTAIAPGAAPATAPATLSVVPPAREDL